MTKDVERRCGECFESKPLAAFYKSKRGRQGIGYRCKECARKTLRKWRSANPEKQKAITDRQVNAMRGDPQRHSKFLEYQRQRFRDAKRRALLKYGNKCACCNESNPKFLSVDHVNSDGYKHRKEVRVNIWYWLDRTDISPNIQVLCYNCNMGRQWNGGLCPHTES